MADFILPVGSWRVSPNGTWAGHRARRPPSVNPGTDYECPMGTPVKAAAAGLVTLAQRTYAGSGGRMVIIKSTVNNKLSEVQYLHLDRVDVREGQQVTQGQVIAMSGASGNGSNRHYGPHLHVSLRIRGENVDFQKYGSTSAPASGGGGSTPIGNDMANLDHDDLLAILTKMGGAVDGHGSVNLMDTMKAVYFYGDRHEARHLQILQALEDLPARIWQEPLPHMLLKQPDGTYTKVSAGSFLSYEPAEHHNTRTQLLEAIAKLSVDGLDAAELERILNKAGLPSADELANEAQRILGEQLLALSRQESALAQVPALRVPGAPGSSLPPEVSVGE
jgi:hypothetical protein